MKLFITRGPLTKDSCTSSAIIACHKSSWGHLVLRNENAAMMSIIRLLNETRVFTLGTDPIYDVCLPIIPLKQPGEFPEIAEVRSPANIAAEPIHLTVTWCAHDLDQSTPGHIRYSIIPHHDVYIEVCYSIVSYKQPC
jgi:hypothetical protein